MKITPTMSRYIARRYVFNLLLLIVGLLMVIYLFDMVELIRRASKRSDIPLTLVFQMGLLKLPEVLQILFPFAVLFSAMFTFWQLTRRYELISARASGFSVWQFLAPILIVAFVFGLIHITVLNPLGSLFLSKYDQMETAYLERSKNKISVFQQGLWLRQGTADQKGYIILHSNKIDQKNWNLDQVMLLSFAYDDSFRERIDADHASLEKGKWVFKNATIHKPGQPKKTKSLYILPTELTSEDIEDSFGSPETMSFWRLPAHIETLENTGFDPTRLKVYYQNLLAQPLMFIAMVLLAASVSLQPPRLRGAFLLIMTGVFLGFTVFLLSSYLQALGVSRQIPVFLAAWSPALICFLLGLTMIMNFEDG